MTTRDNVQLRMMSILMQHLDGDTIFSYNHTTNVVHYHWDVRNAKGDFCYIEKGHCDLDVWFTEEEQEIVLDLLTPRL